MEQSKRTVLMKKAPSLLMLLGLMLATLLAAAAPALAQVEPSTVTVDPFTVTATGVIERAAPIGQDPTPVFAITDEATGERHELISGFVDLGAFVGQRVLIYGVPVPGPGDPNRPELLNVTEVIPLGAFGETVAATFELTIDGEVPEGRSFFVSLDPGGNLVFCATNGDPNAPVCEDGATYSGTLEVPAGSPVSLEYVNSGSTPPFAEVFFSDTRTFAEDATVSATYTVPEGDSANPGGVQAQTAPARTQSGGAQAQLPATGGVSLVALGAVGALLVGGGLLTRRLTR